MLEAGGEQLLDLILVAVVGLHDDRHAALGFDLRASPLRALLVFEVVDDHVGAFARELHGTGMSLDVALDAPTFGRPELAVRIGRQATAGEAVIEQELWIAQAS